MWSGTGSRGDTRSTCLWTRRVGPRAMGGRAGRGAAAAMRLEACRAAAWRRRARPSSAASRLQRCGACCAGKEWTDFVHREDELVTVVSGECGAGAPPGGIRQGASHHGARRTAASAGANCSTRWPWAADPPRPLRLQAAAGPSPPRRRAPCRPDGVYDWRRPLRAGAGGRGVHPRRQAGGRREQAGGLAGGGARLLAPGGEGTTERTANERASHLRRPHARRRAGTE